MPAHDWTKVTPGTFHDFHLAWMAEIRRTLNGGLLPEGFYALAEQVAGDIAPDVLTLQDIDDGRDPEPFDEQASGDLAVAIAKIKPRVTVTDTITEAMVLATRHRRLVIRHTTGDRIVALIEIVSPGNKQGRGALDSFVDKAVAALDKRYHLLIMDLFPPGPLDPDGIHGALWHRLGGQFAAPRDKPLTLAAYRAFGPVTCYVEPIAVGAPLPPMPLFLDPEHYINVPLEPTYMAAWEGVPQRWRRVIEPS